MGFLRIIAAMILFVIGLVLTITIIGAIIGVPLIIIAIYLAYAEKNQRNQEAIREGVKQAINDMEKKDS